MNIRSSSLDTRPVVETMSLSDLTPGTTAVLQQIHDPHARDVLRSLGLVNGAQLRLCRVGDPYIVQVRATRIGMSRAVAQSVQVVKKSAGPES